MYCPFFFFFHLFSALIQIFTDLLQRNANLLSVMHIFCMLNAVINRCFHSTCIQFFTVHLYQIQAQFELISLNCVILGNIFLMSTVQPISRWNSNISYNKVQLEVSFYKLSSFIYSGYIGNIIRYHDHTC